MAAGSESAIVERLRSYRDAGVTDLAARIVPLGDDAAARIESRQRTQAFLATLCPDSEPGVDRRTARRHDEGMAMLTDDMKRVIREQRLGFVATVGPDGAALNLSPKGTTTVLDDDHLVFVDLASPTTMANLRANPAVEVNVVDPITRNGYRFQGPRRSFTSMDPRSTRSSCSTKRTGNSTSRAWSTASR